MTISVGDRLPDATLFRLVDGIPKAVRVSEVCTGRKIVVFGLPAAFSGGCSQMHLPSFMRTAASFFARGVEGIYCVSVNDAFATGAWSEATGAEKAGVTILGDPSVEFTKALGMAFSYPPHGMYDRSKRYAMLVEDGVVSILQEEEKPGICELTTGENLLARM